MSLARLKILLLEIRDDPLNLGLDILNDAERLAALNASTRPGPVPKSEIITHAIDVDNWFRLAKEPRSGAVNIRARLDQFGELEMGDVTVIRDVDNLNGSVFLNGEAAEFLSLGANQQSRAQELGIGVVRQRDLGRMRIEAGKGLI